MPCPVSGKTTSFAESSFARKVELDGRISYFTLRIVRTDRVLKIDAYQIIVTSDHKHVDPRVA